ncbi:MAG: hypothetical protein LBN23_04450 [Paludibacter sp.]|jgi:hypothetical protein|nr:hypothetical protein [Paludibacter sp.]
MLKIVVPCYDEPQALDTVCSVFACERGDFEIELIFVVNSYAISSDEIVAQNRLTFNELNAFAAQNNTPRFFLTPLLYENLAGHQTGAGMPRKIGMDYAAKQFTETRNQNGIILSLDADTVVANNYLTAIYENFIRYKLKSATIQFHHPVEHLPAENSVRQATVIYETYLRYYRDCLEFTGYPYAYFTIGSAFAVTAKTYLQAGGMSPRQAGEDFYFLQKIFPLGDTKFIDATCVYPAARVSYRVPFGTGPAIGRMVENQNFIKLTYQVAAFLELKELFALTANFFRQTDAEVRAALKTLPPHTQEFLINDNFAEKIAEINCYTADIKSFKKRFFNYFTAFKILKYLNFVHPKPYIFKNVKEEVLKLKI